MQGAAVSPRCLCRLIVPPTVLTAWPCGHFQVLIRVPAASEVQLYDLPVSFSSDALARRFTLSVFDWSSVELRGP
eukprot:6758892-Pyramimonas_sp.AAC.1